jgi:hypothetical protein
MGRLPPTMWKDELPPAFVCAICQREIEPDPWHWRLRHKPPICFYCSITQGHQVRIPGMTRGDHHTLQRLSAVTDALTSAAYMEEHRGRFTTV